MVQAIGAASATAALSGGANIGGLEAQLLRYQKQLADCVNCDTANTPQGKADIDALSTKIAETKDRVEQAAQAARADNGVARGSSSSIEEARGRRATDGVPAVAATAAAGAAFKWDNKLVGTIIDQYA